MKSLFLQIGLILFFQTATAETISIHERWGGEGASVTVYSDRSARLDFDCALGNAEGWIYSNKKVLVKGSYRALTGFRPPSGVSPKPLPATYFATVNPKESSMDLRVTVSRSTKSFKLKRNAPSGIRRCM